jgi:tetratricopeptide (TPR) repeat protein
MIRVLARFMAFLLLLPVAFLAAPGDQALQSLMEAGHWKRVRAQVMQRAQANPSDADLAYLLSRVKQAFGDLDGAMELAEKAIALDGRKPEYHSTLAQVCVQKAQFAGMFKALGLAHRFQREAQAVLDLDPKSVDAREGLVDFYLEAPGIAGGDKKKARVRADELVQIDAVKGYLALANIAQHEKDATRQEAALLQAVKANPKNYEAQAGLASYYASDGVKKYEPAEKQVREALIKIDPGRSGAYAILAIVYAKQGRAGDLDALLAQAEKSVPDDLGPYYQAGRALLLDGKDFARAERYFRKYLTQEPEGFQPRWGAAHWRLGLVLEKQGRKSEAVAELRAAVQLEPQLDEAKKDLKRMK